VNRAEALLISKYEAFLSTEGISMLTTEAEDALTQEAITMAWDSLDAHDRRYLARYWKTPEVTS
jgi:hypothetical protein